MIPVDPIVSKSQVSYLGKNKYVEEITTDTHSVTSLHAHLNKTILGMPMNPLYLLIRQFPLLQINIDNEIIHLFLSSNHGALSLHLSAPFSTFGLGAPKMDL